MKFKITSKKYLVYLWFINIFCIALLIIPNLMLYSMGFEFFAWGLAFMAGKIVLSIAILFCLVLAKGPIKILLYVFGASLIIGGVNGIIHQYLMQTSAPFSLILNSYIVASTMSIFGLCVVTPIHRVVCKIENV